MNIFAREIVLGDLYAWIGHHPTTVFSASRNYLLDMPDIFSVSLHKHEIFVPLEIIHIDNRQFDLKVLTAKGDIGYLFRWYMEGIQAEKYETYEKRWRMV